MSSINRKSYKEHLKPLLTVLGVVLLLVTVSSAAPSIEWQKSLGGTSSDDAYSIQQTSDGGYIVAGISHSNDGDVTGNHGGLDYWVIKLDANGNIIWQKCLGGTTQDEAYSIQQTSDGGYIVAGRSKSTDGDVTGNHGGLDYWVIKLDANGNIIWQKCLGGTEDDFVNSIQQTSDGGYIVAGFSESNDGDVTGNHKKYENYYFYYYDYWVVKLDANGNIIWQKSLGGTHYDYAQSIQQTSDGGYIVAGKSLSNDGDVTGNHGGWAYDDYWVGDYWVVKLDTSGDIIWQKCLGGTEDEWAYSIQQTSDGGYIVAGCSLSTDGDVTGNHGGLDYWVIKLDANGNIIWQKSLGGTSWDTAYSIQQTSDGGYIVAGGSHSTDGDVTGNHGGSDYWVIKLDANGNIIWQKSLGGTTSDYAESIQQTSDGGYIVAGYSGSTDGDVTGNHGGRDYWIVKLSSDNGRPTLTSLTPSSITAGSYDFLLEVSGTSFVNGAKVLWDGSERPTVFVSTTKLNATIFKEDVAVPGIHNVRVVNPNIVESNEVNFEVSSLGELLPPPSPFSPGDPISPGPVIDTLTPQFNWTGVSGADEYGLYIRNLDTDNLVFDSRRDGYTITGDYDYFTVPSGILQEGTHYRWDMNSHNSSGWNDDPSSGFSSRLYFTTSTSIQPDTTPIITESLTLSPGPYEVGDTITATFTIKNNGSSLVSFSNLTVGGRYYLSPDGDGQLPFEGGYPDFPHVQVSLLPGGYYTYQENLQVTVPGNYHFFCAYSPYDGDQSGWNTNIPKVSPEIIREVDIQVVNIGQEKVPIILIHGYTGSPKTWNSLITELDSKNIPYYVFDYGGIFGSREYFGIQIPDILLTKGDPRDYSRELNDIIAGLENGSIPINHLDNSQGYHGQFDIICHSMGAVVSRYYIEHYGADHKIRQWIGLGPASNGAAIADKPEINLKNVLGDAVIELKTDSDTIQSLPDNVLNKNTIYHVIVGVNSEGQSNFGNDIGKIINNLFSNYPGTTYVKISENSDQYGWTYCGDSMVSVEQSKIEGATLDYFEGLDHNQINKNKDVIDLLVEYIQDPTYSKSDEPKIILTPSKPMVGGKILFDGNLHSREDKKIYTYHWDFGDGSSSFGSIVEHQYSIPKIYTIKLTITDNEGNSQEITKNLDLTLQPGDIILVRSGNINPGTLVPGDWSHAAMYIGSIRYDQPGSIGYGGYEIVESLKEGVVVNPLSDYDYPKKTYVAVYRVNDMDQDEPVRVAKRALQQEGSWYDIYSIAQCLILLKEQYIPPISPMGKQMACEDYPHIIGPIGGPLYCGQFYCSELVWYAYKKEMNLDLDTWRYGDLVAPSEFAISDQVTLVGEHLEDKPVKLMDPLFGWTKCPVDIKITDPFGGILTKSQNSIPNSLYLEFDVDNDSQMNDLFIICSPVNGTYSFEVIPDDDALPSDEYSFEVGFLDTLNGTSKLIINTSSMIKDTPEKPYHITLENNSFHADFNINQGSGLAPFTVKIIDSSFGIISSRQWSFGDGTSAENVTEVTHTYSQPGNYTVTLTVSGPDGEDSTSQIIQIIGAAVPPISIKNLHNSTYLKNSITWTWTDPESTDFDHVMVYLDCIFHTNVTAGVQQFTANGLSPATEYTIGTRTVGTTGLVNSTWVNQTATTAATSGSDVITPEADFIANVTFAKAPLVVQFTDQSLGYPISSWAWDFGDGANSTEQNPVHTYTSYGMYNVSLTVTNAAGEDTITKNDFIQVIPMVGGDTGYYLIHCNVEGAEVYFDQDSKGVITDGTLLVKIHLTATPYHRYSVSKAGYVTINEPLPSYPVKDQTKDIFVTLVDVTDDNWTRPPYPDTIRVRPEYPDANRTRPEYPDTIRVRPEYPDANWTRPEYPDTIRVRPEYPDANWTRPPYPEVTRIQPGYPDTNRTRPSYLDWLWNRPSVKNFLKDVFG